MELIERSVGCPYCGEEFVALIDLSSGSSAYIEDCEICCRPIQFQLECGKPEKSRASRYGATMIKLLEKGLIPPEVATITGHKGTRILMRYTHLRVEDLIGRLTPTPLSRAL